MLIDKNDVITWHNLRARAYTSRVHFLADVNRLVLNARIYNRGCEVPNPEFTPGGAAPARVTKGPGVAAHPGVAVLADEFHKRVLAFLERDDVAQRVRSFFLPGCQSRSHPGRLPQSAVTASVTAADSGSVTRS